MTITRAFLQNIRETERPFLRQAIALSTHFSETRALVAGEGGDWGALKAILKAEILDEEGGEHLKTVLERADESTQYAGMLGLDINKKNFSDEKPQRTPPVRAVSEAPDDHPTESVAVNLLAKSDGEPPAIAHPSAVPSPAGGSLNSDLNDIPLSSLRTDDGGFVDNFLLNI